MTQIGAILVLAGLGAWWWHSMQVREVAVDAARRGCRAFGVQFLDDSVVLRRFRPRRDRTGRLCLWRTYAFEFTRSGGERRAGYVTLLGRRLLDVHLDEADPGGPAPGRTLH